MAEHPWDWRSDRSEGSMDRVNVWAERSNEVVVDGEGRRPTFGTTWGDVSAIGYSSPMGDVRIVDYRRPISEEKE